MDKKIDEIFEKIKEINDNSCDITTRKIKLDDTDIGIIFLQSTASDDKISNFLGKSLSFDVKKKKTNLFENLFQYLENSIPNSNIKIIDNYDDMFYFLTCGFTCLLVDNYNKAIAIETKGDLNRAITETNTENVIRGPKDSFNENYQTTIGLIRKRIKDSNLIFEETILGTRTKTKIAITYIKDIANMKKVKQLRKDLSKIKVDSILGSSYLRELIIEKQKSIMPQIILTERPDLVSMSLLNGKIAIIVENTPYVLIIPAFFVDYFQTSEDLYSKPFNATTTRILRFFAFIIAVLVPAIYIALTTYDMEALPNSLLISFAIQKEGVPFPTLIEILILITAYEILREADTRKPQIIGASISIVGALILGEAAVSAGIISPIVVIIISISAVSGMVFNDVDIINAVREWRIFYIFAAAIFGMIGVLFVATIFITNMCATESIGIPVSIPLAPIYEKDWKRIVFRFSERKIPDRSTFLTKNKKRLRIKK